MAYEKIPQELKNLKQWVCWKKILTDKGKTTKIPINPYTGRNAMSNTPATWSSFDEAVNAVKTYRLDGIGFMFTSGYFGVDLDNCTEELKQEFMTELNSYTEISQSGKGIHIICRGKLPEGPRRKAGIEMYETQRFFVMTGNSIGPDVINDATLQVSKLHGKYLTSSATQIEAYTFDKETAFSRLEDNEVIKKATASKNGGLFSLLFSGQWEGLYDSQSEADMAFALMLAFWTNKDVAQMDRVFRLSSLMRPKWDRKQNNTTYGAITLANAAAKCRVTYNPEYKEKEVGINMKTGEVDVAGPKKEYELNDTGNAHRFVDRYSDQIRYNYDNRSFMIWNGSYWRDDTSSQIKNMIEVVIDEMKKDAAMEDDREIQKQKLKNVQHAYSSRGKEAMIRESTHIAPLPVSNNDFDKGKKYLNTLSGVVDLSNEAVLEPNKEFLMSKTTNTTISENSPVLWMKFLNEIFNNDAEMIKFIQKSVGYTLTGSTKEQCMFICYGDGANGKSVFLDVVASMLGDYAVNAQVETVMSHKGAQAASSDLARLKGARMVTTSEPNEGSKFNEGLVKQLTGGDKITARFLYGKEFEYKPEFKLWLATNYKPVIRGTDMGIWRRIRLIPFEVQIPREKQDKDLTLKLQKELPAILRWAIQGAALWVKEGLQTPKMLDEAIKDYKNEMDIISSFIEDNCQSVIGWETSASEVYLVYAEWARKGNEYLMSLTRFGKEMSKRFERKRKGQGMVYVNLRLGKDDGQYHFDRFKQ
jgi:putative DNA primase/helicase